MSAEPGTSSQKHSQPKKEVKEDLSSQEEESAEKSEGIDKKEAKDDKKEKRKAPEFDFDDQKGTVVEKPLGSTESNEHEALDISEKNASNVEHTGQPSEI